MEKKNNVNYYITNIIIIMISTATTYMNIFSYLLLSFVVGEM